MGTVYQWIQNLSVWLVLSAVILHLVPGKDYGKYVRFFSGMVLLLLFLEPMLKLTGTDGMITKLYEGNLAKEDQAEKELLQKLYESADLTQTPASTGLSAVGADAPHICFPGLLLLHQGYSSVSYFHFPLSLYFSYFFYHIYFSFPGRLFPAIRILSISYMLSGIAATTLFH